MSRLEVDVTVLLDAATSFQRMADGAAEATRALGRAHTGFGPYYRDLERRIDDGMVEVVAVLDIWGAACTQCGEMLRRHGERYGELDESSATQLAESDRDAVG